MITVRSEDAHTYAAGLEDAQQIMVSVVIPCLNEAGNIQQCVELAFRTLDLSEIYGEVIVSDNGSKDGSDERAERACARVVRELLILGTQVVSLGLCARSYAGYFMGEYDPWFDFARRRLRLEHGLILGSAVALVGTTMIFTVVVEWIERGLGGLAQERFAVAVATLVVPGAQVTFASLLLSILVMRRR